MFCFRDSAKAQAPEWPIPLPKIYTGQLNLVTYIQTATTLVSDIPLRFSWIRVVFCFKDLARAQIPESPILLPKTCTNQLRLATLHSNSHHTDFRYTLEIQLGKGYVLLQRLDQSADT